MLPYSNELKPNCVSIYSLNAHPRISLLHLAQHEHCRAYAACRTDILLPVVDLFEPPQFKRKVRFQYQQPKVRRFTKNIV